MSAEVQSLARAMLDAPPFVIVPSVERAPLGYYGPDRIPARFVVADVFGQVHVWHHERATVGDAYARDDGRYYAHGWGYWLALPSGPIFDWAADAIEGCTLHEMLGGVHGRRGCPQETSSPYLFAHAWHLYRSLMRGFDEEGWRALPPAPPPKEATIVRVGSIGAERYENEMGGRVWRTEAGAYGWMERSGMGSHILGDYPATLEEAKRRALGGR